MVETSNTLLLARAASSAEAGAFSASPEGAALNGVLGLVIEGTLGGTHEFRRVVPRLDLVRTVLAPEEWCDAEGGFPATRGATSSRIPVPPVAVAAKAAVATAPRAEYDEDEAAAREMEEEEAAVAAGAVVSSTMVVDLETEDAVAARETALAEAPLRLGPYDAQLQSAPRAARGWTLAELGVVVPASAAEIEAELHRLGAACPAGDGRWMLLSKRYAASVLDDVLRAAAAEGWDAASMPVAALCAACDNHPRGVVTAVLRSHSAHESGGDGVAALCPKKVAVSRARTLLAALDGVTSGWAQFERVWAADVERVWPSAPAPPVAADWLRGIVLFVAPPQAPPGAQKTHVKYFPEDALPSDPAARFKALFDQRPLWAEADLLPFVEPLATPYRKLMDIVATHSRVSIAKDKSRAFSKK
jgi:hypothetical protein